MPDTFQSRTELLLGADGVERLRQAHVLVVGLGGVGGYAAEALCRAGLGRLTIVDGDTVSQSNINRQIIALRSTVGRPKSEVFAERFRDINPDCDVTAINTFLRDDEMINLLETGQLKWYADVSPAATQATQATKQSSNQTIKQSFDYLVDAIDTLSPKVFLLYHSRRLGIPTVSAMGSAGKLDPSKIQVADIAQSYNCPLAAMVRKKLHKLGVRDGIKAVFSAEKPRESSMIEDPSQNKRTTVGVISYMPAMFGCLCAATVINDLVGHQNDTNA